MFGSGERFLVLLLIFGNEDVFAVVGFKFDCNQRCQCKNVECRCDSIINSVVNLERTRSRSSEHSPEGRYSLHQGDQGQIFDNQKVQER